MIGFSEASVMLISCYVWIFVVHAAASSAQVRATVQLMPDSIALRHLPQSDNQNKNVYSAIGRILE